MRSEDGVHLDLVDTLVLLGFIWGLVKLICGSLLGTGHPLAALGVVVAAGLHHDFTTILTPTPLGLALALVYAACLLRSVEPRQVGIPGLVVAVILATLSALCLIAGATYLDTAWTVIPASAAGSVGVVYLIASFLPPKTKVRLRSPVRHAGLCIMSRGIGPLKNIHFWHRSQRWARDLCVYDPASPGTNVGEGLPVTSPLDAVVERCGSDGLLGEHVLLRGRETGSHYVLIAHLQAGSTEVTTGAAITAGAALGRLGNTGNSTEPHVHLQVQNGPDFGAAKTLPFTFTDQEIPVAPLG